MARPGLSASGYWCALHLRGQHAKLTSIDYKWITKGFGFVLNTFEVYISFHPKTEVITACIRLLTNAVASGIAGVIEFILSHIEGAGPILRLIADQIEWMASTAGLVAVLGAEAGEPNTIAWSLGTNAVLDVINVGLSEFRVSLVSTRY